jgi:hypothetical protein
MRAQEFRWALRRRVLAQSLESGIPRFNPMSEIARPEGKSMNVTANLTNASKGKAAVAARKRAKELYLSGLDSPTRIHKQLTGEGHMCTLHQVNNWRKRDHWSPQSRAQAMTILDTAHIIQRATADIRDGSTIALGLNELGAVVYESAQKIREMLPRIVGEIATPQQFTAFIQAISAVAQSNVLARTELLKVLPIVEKLVGDGTRVICPHDDSFADDLRRVLDEFDSENETHGRRPKQPP